MCGTRNNKILDSTIFKNTLWEIFPIFKTTTSASAPWPPTPPTPPPPPPSPSSAPAPPPSTATGRRTRTSSKTSRGGGSSSQGWGSQGSQTVSFALKYNNELKIYSHFKKKHRDELPAPRRWDGGGGAKHQGQQHAGNILTQFPTSNFSFLRIFLSDYSDRRSSTSPPTRTIPTPPARWVSMTKKTRQRSLVILPQ